MWVILLTFFIAYLLAIVPFPEWAMSYRPEWVPLVLIYWVMALPYRFGIGSAWVVGLVLDILEGSILGLNALALVALAYITLSLHMRLRMFSTFQQSGLIIALKNDISVEFFAEKYSSTREIGIQVNVRADVVVQQPGKFAVLEGITA